VKTVIIGDDPKARRLMEAFNRLRRFEWHKTRGSQCKGSEIRLLFFISRGCREDARGVTISTLSAMMDVTSPTVTPLIKGLESNGLIIRYNDQEDRRVVRVQLTEKGNEVTKEAVEFYKKRFMGLYDYLGEEKSAQLSELLEQVHQYVDERDKIIKT
jgi:DNA-binding MarR family transcriptional regulator